MKETLLKIIQEEQERKEREGIIPTHTLRLDLNRIISNALNELYREGKIEVGPTVNDKWIRIKK